MAVSPCTLFFLSSFAATVAYADPADSIDVSKEPEPVALSAGQPAPYAGILLSQPRALKLGAKVESCEFKLKLNTQLFDSTMTLRLDAAKAKLEIEKQAAEEQNKLLTTQLAEARKQAVREWWEQPGVLLWTGVAGGVVLGVAATVGAILGVAQLRPAIPN